MWTVGDGETNKITSTFYKHMVDESGRLDHTRAAFARLSRFAYLVFADTVTAIKDAIHYFASGARPSPPTNLNIRVCLIGNGGCLYSSTPIKHLPSAWLLSTGPVVYEVSPTVTRLNLVYRKICKLQTNISHLGWRLPSDMRIGSFPLRSPLLIGFSLFLIDMKSGRKLVFRQGSCRGGRKPHTQGRGDRSRHEHFRKRKVTARLSRAASRSSDEKIRQGRENRHAYLLGTCLIAEKKRKRRPETCLT